MFDPARSFDIIGDVHGCALTLERLLDAMGYKRQGRVAPSSPPGAVPRRYRRSRPAHPRGLAHRP